MPPATAITTAADVFAELATEGFTPGAPAVVPAAYVAIDRDTAGEMRCPRCRKRGLAYEPFRRGREYRAVAWCPACLAAEEM